MQPRSSSFLAISMAGASRRSSVLGLNARPSNPMVRPLRIFNSPSNFSTTRSRWRRLISRAASTIGMSEVVFSRRGHQCRGIFPEAGPAPADAGLQEPCSDACVEPDSLGYLRNVRANLFGQLADFVDVEDLQWLRNAFAAYLMSSADARSVEISGTAPSSSGRGRNVGGANV